MAEASAIVETLRATALSWATVAHDRLSAAAEVLMRPSVLLAVAAGGALLGVVVGLVAYRATRKAATAQQQAAQALTDALQGLQAALGDLHRDHTAAAARFDSHVFGISREIDALHAAQDDNAVRLETRIEELRTDLASLRAEHEAGLARLDRQTEELVDRLVLLRDGLHERHDDLTNQSRLVLQAIASLRNEVVEQQTAKYRVNEAIRRVMPPGNGNA